MEAVKILALAAFLCIATVDQTDAQYYYASYPYAYAAPSLYYPMSYGYGGYPYMIGKRSVKFRSLKEGLSKDATEN